MVSRADYRIVSEEMYNTIVAAAVKESVLYDQVQTSRPKTVQAIDDDISEVLRLVVPRYLRHTYHVNTGTTRQKHACSTLLRIVIKELFDIDGHLRKAQLTHVRLIWPRPGDAADGTHMQFRGRDGVDVDRKRVDVDSQRVIFCLCPAIVIARVGSDARSRGSWPFWSSSSEVPTTPKWRILTKALVVLDVDRQPLN